MGAYQLQKHHHWKGADACYTSKHERVRRLYGRPLECAWCLKPNRPIGRSIIQYANISGEFKLEREDWVLLCASCHKKFDFNEETPKRMSKARLGKPLRRTEKSIEAQKRRAESRKRPIESISLTGEVEWFDSLKSASERTGALKGNLVRACKTGRTAKGLRWRYVVEQAL